jgi:ABC-type transport system substrate-binding protein
MAFNMRIFPGSDKAFRQSVGCIVDKEFVINNVLQGVAINMDGQMPAALTAWVAPVTGVLADCDGLSAEERWNKSVEILQAGGWTATDWGSHPGGADRAIAPTGLKGPGGETPPSDMLLYAPGPGYDPIRSTFSLFIADWMQQLGFDVVARPTGFSVIVDKVFTPENCKDWYFYMLGWGLGSFPDHPEAFFASYNDTCEGGYNTPGYNNAEFDALAAEFKAAKKVSDAQAISKKMEALLFDDMPYLVLVTTPILEVYRDNISFPFTDVLSGLTGTGSGYPGNVKVNK